MENTKEFTEGIESYRKRLINELQDMSVNVDGFVDSRNGKHQLRILVQQYRRALEKANLYIGYIEEIVEKSDDQAKII